MEVVCSNCQGKFRVADEKIPQGRALSLKCPKCESRIEVQANSAGGTGTKGKKGEVAGRGAASSAPDVPERPFDYVRAGMKTALLCDYDEKIRQKVRPALEQMNYHVVEPPSARNALKYMRFHVYDLIIVGETFEATGAESNPVLQYLENLPMYIRRNMFIVLLSDKFRTMDTMIAFNRSVNLVVNFQDAHDMENILQAALLAHEEFYQVFKDVLKRVVGRA
jgi:predicted Zn finger-like uncharacterized protein